MCTGSHTGRRALLAAALVALGCALSPADVPNLMAGARKAAEEGRHTDALRDLRQARTLAPRDPDLLLLHGIVALRADRPGEAEEVLAQAVQVAPHDPRPLAAHGLALRALARYEDAESALLRSLMLRPADAATLAALGEVYRLWGKPEQCATRYEQSAWQLERAVDGEPSAQQARAIASARGRMEACEADAKASLATREP